MNPFSKVIASFRYISRMGLKWTLFRLKYVFRRKTGYFDRKNRQILKAVKFAKDSDCFKDIKLPTDICSKDFKGDHSFIEKADNAIKGRLFAFSHSYYGYSTQGREKRFMVDGRLSMETLEPSTINNELSTKKNDWHYNPVSGVSSPNDVPWNKLPDFGSYGDIKNIWEASRFPQVYFFINAYSKTKDQKYANACINQIIDWCEENPFPYGVNFKCGQEIAFRLFSWFVALDYFSAIENNGEFLCNENLFRSGASPVLENIYTSLLRIDANIDFAAESVKS